MHVVLPARVVLLTSNLSSRRSRSGANLSARPSDSHSAFSLTRRQLGGLGSGSRGAATVGRRQPPLVPCAGSGNGWGSPPENSRVDRQQRKIDQQIVLGLGIGLTLLVILALKLGGDTYQDADVWDLGGGDGFGTGDALGAVLWATSLWFCSPAQLLLIFFGNIEVERPSDWALQLLGRAANLDVDAIDYRVPAALQAVAVALFAAVGFAIASAFQVLLGDATWSVSTGLGACMAAAMYEVGRPARLSVEEAQEKELVWQDFAKFADDKLVRRGRCHETEILRALQRQMPKYRSESAGLDSITLRALVRNWAPDAERSSNGYYKGISLQPAGGAANTPSSPASTSSIDSSMTDSTDQY